jgi:peptidoglycan/LPS O-acetylase OafA/YrhL
VAAARERLRRTLAARDLARERAVPSGSPRGDYRPALDGVRAVAVLAVIAFHVGSNRPAGGFLGVDIFFVLSGYLITTLLLREFAETGSIRFGHFWVRRARRLLPALLLVLVVCAGVVFRTSTPTALGARRSDMLSALFYYANWHFIARSQSYFAAFTAGTSPLLHTWSLAIEEQFYLVWPLFIVVALYVCRGRPLRLVPVLVLLAVGSALRMAWLYDGVDPSRAYYGTDARAQALLVGATLAALLFARPRLLTAARAQSAAAWAGPLIVLCLLAALAGFHERSWFYYDGGAPAFAAATAVGLWIVEARPRGFPGAVLCWAPVRWIGRISYGLYLWHWPLIAWLAPGWTHGRRSLQLLEVAATFLIAATSYYAVELPIRTGGVPWLRRSQRRLVLVLGTGVVIVAALAVAATHPGSALARAADDPSVTPCPSGSPSAGLYYIGTGQDPAMWCVRTKPSSKTSSVVVTIGDSTSNALDPGMRIVAAARGWRYIQAGLNGCSILRLGTPPGLDAVAARQAESCSHVAPRLIDQIKAAYHPTVWIVSDLTGLASGEPNGDPPARIRNLQNSISSELARMVSGGARVVLIAPEPNGQPAGCASTPPPADDYCDAQHWTPKDPLTVFMARLDLRALTPLRTSVAYVSLNDILCPQGTCTAMVDGMLGRPDSVHFTGTFSKFIVPTLIARAAQAGVPFTRRR